MSAVRHCHIARADQALAERGDNHLSGSESGMERVCHSSRRAPFHLRVITQPPGEPFAELREIANAPPTSGAKFREMIARACGTQLAQVNKRGFAWVNNCRRLDRFLEESQKAYRAFMRVYFIKHYLKLLF